MSSLADLGRRLSRKLESGKGICLSAADVAMLETCGALAIYNEAVAFETDPRAFPVIGRRAFCADCAPYVYFIQAGDAGPIKIGVTRNAKQRITGHQTSNHEKLHLRALVSGLETNEMLLHHFYAAEHIRGEWFRPSLRLMAFVAELAQ